MKPMRLTLILFVAVLIVFAGLNIAQAEVYTSYVRITQEDSNLPFDGSFADNSGAAIRFILNHAADSVVIQIIPTGGGPPVKTLRASSLAGGDNAIQWDGSANAGGPAGAGSYRFELTAYHGGFGSYTEYHLSTPAIFTRGSSFARNPLHRWFGFIYSASGGGYATGAVRHASNGRQWGNAPDTALLTTTGLSIGSGGRRYATTVDNDGYAVLIGLTERDLFRYHLDTLDVTRYDSSNYGMRIQGLDMRGSGANKFAIVTGDSTVFGVAVGNQTFNTVPPVPLIRVTPGKRMVFWDAKWGSDSSLYVVFRADSALGQYTTRPRGIMKFDMRSGTLPKTIADSAWTSIMADGDPITLALDEGTLASASDDILYLCHDLGTPNTVASGVYAFTNLSTTAPTRSVAWADPDNNASSDRGSVAVDAVGNVVYFENSNEQVVLISPPGGPNSYMYASPTQTTITTPGVTPPLLTLAAARIDLDGDRRPDLLGDTVRVIGVINSLNIQTTNIGYFMQDATAGIHLFAFNQLGAPVLRPGYRVRVLGRIDYFRGLTEIIPLALDSTTHIVVLDTGNVITPIDLTIGQYKANPEAYESRLIKLSLAHPLNFTSANWPPAGASTSLKIWNGVDTLFLRLDSDTPVPGSPYPNFPVRLTGAATQFTLNASDTGYQVTPMFPSHFEPFNAPPLNTFSLLTPANGSEWFIDSAGTYRFTWRRAVDFNGDTLIYQYKPVDFAGSLADGAGRDSVKTFTGTALLGYLGTNNSLLFRWTVLADDPANPPVSSRDTFAVTLRRNITPPAGWTAQTSGVTVNLRTVKAVNPAVAWIGGATGIVMRTTNAGTTWQSVAGGQVGTGNVHSITAVNENIALAASSPADAFIYRTTDGGTTWDTVFSQTGGFINAVHMINATTGFAMGDPVSGFWTILKTTDGGASWARIATEPPQVGAEAGWVNSFHMIGSTHMWFGTNASKVYRSTDGGLTWSSGPTTAVSSYAVWFNSPSIGVAGFSTGAVERTTDGGATWSAVTFPGAGTIYGVGGAGTNDYWIPRGNMIYRSTDHGVTWASEYTSTIGASLRHVQFVTQGPTTAGWVGSSTGGIASFFGTVTDVEERGNDLPQTFSLGQNYPNPFNPSTTIRYALATSASVRLTVYNSLGQEVAVLRDEVQETGYHVIQWNGRNSYGAQVATGVYFYHLQATPLDGSAPFSNVKKMMMLK